MKARERTRVLVVDDDGDLRTLVRVALDLHGGFDVVAEAGNATAAVAAAAATPPDIVVLDLGLPDLIGTDVLDKLRHAAPQARIIVFSGRSFDTDMARLVEQADGYVLKGDDLEYLIEVLGRLAALDPPVAAITLSPDPASAARARQFVQHQCVAWGCSELLEDVLLVVSELVTNAAMHAGSALTLRLRLTDYVLRVEVTDETSRSPSPQVLDLDAEGGRGLLLVAALSHAWGIDPADAGKVVWAELARTG